MNKTSLIEKYCYLVDCYLENVFSKILGVNPSPLYILAPSPLSQEKYLLSIRVVFGVGPRIQSGSEGPSLVIN